MPKRAISLTLDEANLLWLRGRGYGRGNLSAAGDDLIRGARAGGLGGPAPVRSVIGTIDLAADDPHLDRADAAVRDVFARSLSRPTQGRERSAAAKPDVRKRRRRG